MLGRQVVTLLDTGAAANAVSEELLVGCINRAQENGLSASDPRYPIVQLEQHGETEAIVGIARGRAVQVIGAVVLRL
eukprot:13447695-Alexandrium_andersonii.AAC.1